MYQEIIDFVNNVICNTVDFPEKVKIDCSTSTKNIIIQIKADKSDIGKIIGKKGKNIESLKTLSLAIKNTKYPTDKKDISLEVLE
jgi:predicted RNA-binding protein YlqC (UPF0109 family)